MKRNLRLEKAFLNIFLNSNSLISGADKEKLFLKKVVTCKLQSAQAPRSILMHPYLSRRLDWCKSLFSLSN